MERWYALRLATDVAVLIIACILIVACYYRFRRGKREALRYVRGLALIAFGAAGLLIENLSYVPRIVSTPVRWGSLAVAFIGLILMERQWRLRGREVTTNGEHSG